MTKLCGGKKLAVVLLTVILLMVYFIPVANAQGETYDRYMDEGKRLYDEYRLDEAMVAFDNAIKLDGSKADPYYYKGVIFHSQNKYEQAIQQYDKVLKISPNDTDALLWKGKCLEKMGKKEEALSYYNKVIEIDPENAYSYMFKGTLLKEQGKNTEAKSCIKMVLKLEPSAAFFDTERDITMQIANPYISFNGEIFEVDPGKGTMPVIISGRTFLPIRALIEALGGKVKWNSNENKIVLNIYTKTIELFVDQTFVFINGEKKDIDVAPSVINDRTFLPVRFIAETVGCEIKWDDIGEFITIKLDNVNIGTFDELYSLFNIRHERWFDWNGKGLYAKGINNIRNNLGDKFEEELFKFIENDIEGYYWCGNFLLEECYLFGNKPLPELALKLYDKGLSLPAEGQDTMFMSHKVSLSIIAAIENKKCGNTEKAKDLKAQAEKLMKENPDLLGAFPAIDDEERNIYDSL